VASVIAAVFTACATAKPSAPDTPKQAKVRTDIEQCNSASGDKAYQVAVTPEGKYSFQVIGTENAETILKCMTSKGYSGTRIDFDTVAYTYRRRSGGEGEPSR
jgi:hypothetical protein